MTATNEELVSKSVNTSQMKGTTGSGTDSVTILTCREPDKQATKKFVVQKDGAIEKVSFSAGKFFTHEQKSVASIYDLSNVLTALMDKPCSFIIRGAPMKDAKQTVMRRINNPGAAFDPMPHYYVALDIDKQKCPEHLDPIKDPEGAARWARELLPPDLRGVTCFYKFSSSQSVPKKVGESPVSVISVHFWFWCNRKISEGEWKRYFKANPCPVDQALFSPVQIHYTANPIFVGMGDPLPNRSGIIKGDSDIVIMPLIPKLEIRHPIQRSEKIRRSVRITVTRPLSFF